MKKKKILFFVFSLGIGGTEKVLITIANKLVEQDYSITIVTWLPHKDLLPELDKRVRYIYKPPKVPFGKKIPYIRYKFYDDNMWEARASSKALYRYYIGREKYDVEIAFFFGKEARIISGSTNRKALRMLWIHNIINDLAAIRMRNNKDTVYSAFDKVICVSHGAARRYSDIMGTDEKIAVIYNPIPEDSILRYAEKAPETAIEKARFHIVTVGRLSDYEKGQSRLIEAVARLHAEGADISLSIVGDGADRPVFEKLIEEKSASDYIFLTGGTTNPYPYIKEASLCVCSSYVEGYGLTISEAMVLGVPVLSTDCIGPNEILDNGQYGMIVENSTDGLYEGIKELYDDPAKLRVYREKAASRVDFFDEDRIIGQIIDVLEKNENAETIYHDHRDGL